MESDIKNIVELTGAKFRSAIEALNLDQLTTFIHDMNPKQRNIFLFNLKNDEINGF